MSGNPARVGYAAMLERFAPREAVRLSALAEELGFEGVMASDHFQPWVPAQGEAAFVWNVLAAAGEHTRGDLGGVTTPGYRMHPAVVAQAAATLAALHPGRTWLGLGSGEALNEHVTGEYWPEAPARIGRMFEALDLIQRLFAASLAGKDTSFAGEHYRHEATRLWTMPVAPPPIHVATAGPVTARRAGRVADGLITQSAAPERLATLLDRFRQGARESGRDGATAAVRVHLSWAPTREAALAQALAHWPNGAMRFPHADLRSPYDFAQLAKIVRPEDLDDRVFVSADPDAHRAHLQRLVDQGWNRLYLHQVGPDQETFLRTFAADVLPALVP